MIDHIYLILQHINENYKINNSKNNIILWKACIKNETIIISQTKLFSTQYIDTKVREQYGDFRLQSSPPWIILYTALFRIYYWALVVWSMRMLRKWCLSALWKCLPNFRLKINWLCCPEPDRRCTNYRNGSTFCESDVENMSKRIYCIVT